MPSSGCATPSPTISTSSMPRSPPSTGCHFHTDPASAVEHCRPGHRVRAGTAGPQARRSSRPWTRRRRPTSCWPAAPPGFGPSSFQDACRRPERVVVAHPFNPPHLVPLVEVVGGRLTSEDTVAGDDDPDDCASAVDRSGSAPSCPATWSTGCRRRCGARPTTWSAGEPISVADLDLAVVLRPRPALGAAGPDRDPAPLGRARRAWRTCSSTSARRWWTGGPTSATPELTPGAHRAAGRRGGRRARWPGARRTRSHATRRCASCWPLKDRLGLSLGSVAVAGGRPMRDQGLGSWPRRRARMTPGKAGARPGRHADDVRRPRPRHHPTGPRTARAWCRTR